MTLDEAFDWHEATRSQLALFARIGQNHWGRSPEDDPLWKDDRFKSLEAGEIVAKSRLGLGPLDDFAVMVPFSAFESIARKKVSRLVEVELERAGPGLLAGLIGTSLQELRKRGFHRLIGLLKRMDSDLVEKVNQVRRYRNWVARGRPEDRRPSTVDSEMAYDRLKRFLETLPGP